MLTVQDCQKFADELEKAAGRLHLRSHREAYLAVAAEWRRLADALARGAGAAEGADGAATEHIARLNEAAGKALDSPLRRSLQKMIGGWELMAGPVAGS